MDRDRKNLQRLLAMFAAFSSMAFFGLAAGCATVNWSPIVCLSLAAAGIALMFAAASFLKG